MQGYCVRLNITETMVCLLSVPCTLHHPQSIWGFPFGVCLSFSQDTPAHHHHPDLSFSQDTPAHRHHPGLNFSQDTPAQRHHPGLSFSQDTPAHRHHPGLSFSQETPAHCHHPGLSFSQDKTAHRHRRLCLACCYGLGFKMCQSCHVKKTNS